MGILVLNDAVQKDVHVVVSVLTERLLVRCQLGLNALASRIERFFLLLECLEGFPAFFRRCNQPLEALFRDGGILTFQRIRDRSLTGFYRIENFFPAREHILLKQGFFVLVLEAGKNPGGFSCSYCRTEATGRPP